MRVSGGDKCQHSAVSIADKKGAADAKRGKLFTKLAQAITVVPRVTAGGPTRPAI